MTLIHDTLATYGVGSGNAPALFNMGVGHLRVASFIYPKPYEQFNLNANTWR